MDESVDILEIADPYFEEAYIDLEFLEEEPGSQGRKPYVPLRTTTGRVHTSKKSRIYLGIDFGKYALKGVAVEEAGTRRLVWMGIHELDPDQKALSDEETAEVVQRWLAELPAPAKIVVGVDTNTIRVKYLRLPVVGKKEFEDAARLEMLSDPEFQEERHDLTVVPFIRPDEEFSDGLIYIIDRERIRAMTQTLHFLHKYQVVFRPLVLGPASLFLPHSLHKALAVADIGAQHTRICILAEGRVPVVRDIPFGSELLTEEFLQFVEDRGCAEACKRQAVLISPRDELDHHTLAVNGEERSCWSLHQTFSDIASTIAYFELNHREGVDELYVLGGGARLKGLTDILQIELDIPVKQISSEQLMTASEAVQKSTLFENMPRFLTAVGLTQEPHAGSGIHDVLLFTAKRKKRLSGKAVLAMTALLAMLSGSAALHYSVRETSRSVAAKKAYIEALELRIDELKYQSESRDNPMSDKPQSFKAVPFTGVLDWISSILPDNAWITHLQTQEHDGKNVLIEGIAPNSTDVKLLLRATMETHQEIGEIRQFRAVRHQQGFKFNIQLDLYQEQ